MSNQPTVNQKLIPEALYLMKLNGLMLQPGSIWSRIVPWAVSLLTFFLIIPQVQYSLANFENLLEVMDCLTPFVEIALTTAKMLLWIFIKDDISDLIRNLQETIAQTPKEFQFYDEEAERFSRSLTRWYTFIFAFVCTNFALLPFGKYFVSQVSESAYQNYTIELPYKTIYAWDLDNVWIFAITYSIILVIVYILATGLAGTDTTFISLTYHVYNRFRILNKEALILEISQDMQTLKSVIKKHNECIQLNFQLEKAFNGFVFINTLMASIILAMVFFQLSIWFGLNEATFRIIGYVVAALVQFYIFCWVSDLLLKESGEFSNTMYNLPWYTFPNSQQKLIILIMERAQIPNGITAGKFYIMSLSIFQAIIRTSYSYFALLKTVTN